MITRDVKNEANRLWTPRIEGISNPIPVIEQISSLVLVTPLDNDESGSSVT
jgi:hypothetical protein